MKQIVMGHNVSLENDNDGYLQAYQFCPDSELIVPFQLSHQTDIAYRDGGCGDLGAIGNSQGPQPPDYDVMLAEMIQESGRFNFEGLRIPVHSRWNTDLLSQLLINYHDRQVAELIKYGWPIGRDPSAAITDTIPDNHKGARDFPEHIHEFIAEELKEFAIAGPYEYPAFGSQSVFSPLNSRPKRRSNRCRVIMDLSWPPEGTSVNSGINKNVYLGQNVKLKYPTVSSFVDRIKKLGPSCFMYKRDLHRAFFQVPLCPSAYRYLGFAWDGKFYFSKVLAMGLTSACYIMQCITLCFRYIHNMMGYYLCSYVDDMVGCEAEYQVALEAYQALGRTFCDLGVRESEEKAVPPTTLMEFLGNLLNTVTMTISVTPDRLLELEIELSEWKRLPHITRRELESIIGKLQFLCNCVRSGRLFLNRLLNFLRTTVTGRRYKLPLQAIKDLEWWHIALHNFRAHR